MHAIKIILMLLVSVSAVFCGGERSQPPAEESKVSYAAFYFHPTARCESCLNLEAFAKELIESKFSKTGFVFKSIDIDEEENEHYKKDFGLTFSSLVLVKYKNGSQLNWKNLESVWSYTNDKEKFFGYTEKEIKNFITE